MRIIIIRHGQTLANLQDAFMGHLPGTLSDLGIEQAKKVALRLKDERIDYIFSSDLARSHNTAKEIAKFHQDIPFTTSVLLREFDMGSWNGKTRKEVGFKERYIPPLPSDSETWPIVYERAKTFLEGIKSHINKTILLVGHDGINRALIAVLTKRTPEEIKEIPHRQNTAVDIFELVNGIYQPIVLNCVKHLD